MKVFFDSSVLIAASLDTHVHNSRATAIFEETLRRRSSAYVSSHGLAEVYSVLTRTPFSPSMRPDQAWRILETDFLPMIEIVALTASEYRQVIRGLVGQGISGGLVYDAIHIRCALKAGCDRIYTFDVRDFQRLAPELESRICAP